MRPTSLPPRLRLGCLAVAALVTLATFVPPLSHLARRYELGQILRYGLWALVVPALVVLGAPWKHTARAAALARERARHPELNRAVAFFVLDGLVMVGWFTPAAVRATAAHPWLAVAEAATLIGAGSGLWLELVESPPLVPRSLGLRRVVLGAAAMWLVWIEAYLVAMSGSAWYANFSHQAGKGLSRAADQQVAAAVLWLVATAVFVPVIFLAAMRWLHSGGDADDELRRLLKEQRRGVGLLPEPRAGGPPDGAG